MPCRRPLHRSELPRSPGEAPVSPSSVGPGLGPHHHREASRRNSCIRARAFDFGIDFKGGPEPLMRFCSEFTVAYPQASRESESRGMLRACIMVPRGLCRSFQLRCRQAGSGAPACHWASEIPRVAKACCCARAARASVDRSWLRRITNNSRPSESAASPSNIPSCGLRGSRPAATAASPTSTASTIARRRSCSRIVTSDSGRPRPTASQRPCPSQAADSGGGDRGVCSMAVLRGGFREGRRAATGL